MVFFHMALVAAKKEILRKWKAVQPPSSQDWIKEMIKCTRYIQAWEEAGKQKINQIWDEFLEAL